MSLEASIRRAELAGGDAAVVGALVEAYLLQTQREKAEHLGDAVLGRIPEPYRAEIDDPASAYAHASVFLAELNGAPAGVAIIKPLEGAHELKRVWVDPSARGHGLGSALITAALGRRELPTRLSVWDWRADAIHLYRKHGFVDMPTWEDRERLLCMEAPAA